MITVEPPYYLAKGITVLRDHQDPDQFYFLPATVALAARGDGLALTLYKYRTALGSGLATDGSADSQARGAGLALFETELSVPSLAALQAEVAAQSGRSNARVVPLMFREAAARALIAHPDGGHLIEDLVETHSAPLVSPYHAAFTLALSPGGAALFEQAARGDGLPVGVVYELRFLALTQALHAHVTMNFDQAWDRFSASLGFTYVVKAQLDLEMAWLLERDLLRIDITTFSDSDDAAKQREAVMALVTARVQGDFFRAALPPTGAEATPPTGPLAQLLGGSGGSKVTSGTAMFVLKAKYEAVKETKSFELTWDGRTTLELVHTASGYLATMSRRNGEDGPAPDIREIDATDPFFASLLVSVLGAFDFDAQADLREAVVSVTHGERREAFVFSRAAVGPFQFHAPLSGPTDDSYQFDLRYGFDADAGQGPLEIAAGPFTTRDRVLVINPLDQVIFRSVRFVLGPVDPARVPRMHVAVRVPGGDGEPDLATARYTLDAQSPEQVFRLHLPSSSSSPATPGSADRRSAPRVFVSTQWEDAGGQIHDAADEEVTAETFVVLGPFRDVIELLVTPAADFSVVSQLLVTVHYEDGDDVFERVLSFDAAGKGAGQRLRIPLLDPHKRTYRYRVAVFGSDGTRDDGGWQSDDAAVLVVGGQKKTTAPLQVVWVGPSGDALGLRLDVWATGADGQEQQQSIFLRGGADTTRTIAVPLDGDGLLAYRFELRKEGATGETLLRSDHGSTPLLVVQLPSA